MNIRLFLVVALLLTATSCVFCADSTVKNEVPDSLAGLKVEAIVGNVVAVSFLSKDVYVGAFFAEKGKPFRDHYQKPIPGFENLTLAEIDNHAITVTNGPVSYSIPLPDRIRVATPAKADAPLLLANLKIEAIVGDVVAVSFHGDQSSIYNTYFARTGITFRDRRQKPMPGLENLTLTKIEGESIIVSNGDQSYTLRIRGSKATKTPLQSPVSPFSVTDEKLSSVITKMLAQNKIAVSTMCKVNATVNFELKKTASLNEVLDSLLTSSGCVWTFEGDNLVINERPKDEEMESKIYYPGEENTGSFNNLVKSVLTRKGTAKLLTAVNAVYVRDVISNFKAIDAIATSPSRKADKVLKQVSLQWAWNAGDGPCDMDIYDGTEATFTVKGLNSASTKVKAFAKIMEDGTIDVKLEMDIKDNGGKEQTLKESLNFIDGEVRKLKGTNDLRVDMRAKVVYK